MIIRRTNRWASSFCLNAYHEILGIDQQSGE